MVAAAVEININQKNREFCPNYIIRKYNCTVCETTILIKDVFAEGAELTLFALQNVFVLMFVATRYSRPY
jgi:hypothetical protein